MVWRAEVRRRLALGFLVLLQEIRIWMLGVRKRRRMVVRLRVWLSRNMVQRWISWCGKMRVGRVRVRMEVESIGVAVGVIIDVQMRLDITRLGRLEW